jgi:hypothetical protein
VSGPGWAAVAVGVVTVMLASKKGRKRVKKAVGVYMDEVSSGAKPIEAVGTAVAAFVGFAPRGPVYDP